MDELPPDARRFLADAKGVHDPHDAEARERIEKRLFATLALGGTTELARAQAASRAGTTGLGAWLGSNKIMVVSVVLTFMAGGAWLSLHGEAPLAASSPSSIPVAEASPASEPAGAPQVTPLAVADAPAQIGATAQGQGDEGTRGSEPEHGSAEAAPAGIVKPAGSLRAQRTAAASKTSQEPSSLAAETALLARASEQLTQRNARDAARLLAEHGRLYPNSQLHEEREGFLVMTHCLHGSPSAPDEARAFVSEHPASVLVPRLSHLCAL